MRPNRIGALLSAALMMFLCATAARAQSPTLERVLPRAGQRGTEVDLQLLGTRVADAREILFYEPGLRVTSLTAKSPSEVIAHLKIDASAAIGEHTLRLRTDGGITELRTFWVTALPIVQTDPKHPNIEFDKPQPLALNTIAAGVIGGEEVNYFIVNARKGQRLTAEVAGMRLGDANFDPYLAILDRRKFSLAASDDTPLLKQDCFASIIVPRDNQYIIAVRDSAFTGNPDFHYLLSVGTFPRPHVSFPLGGQVGHTIAARFIGDVSGDITQSLALPSSPVDMFSVWASFNGQQPPSPNYLRVSPFPDSPQDGRSFDAKSAKSALMDPPLAFNGVISKPGQTDSFHFKARRGHRLELTVWARRLGSPLDSVIVLDDAKGKYLASNDDTGGPDSYLAFNPPEDGEYVVHINDQLHAGGPDYVYRIEVTIPRPNVILSIAPATQVNGPTQERQTIPVPRGGRYAAVIRAARADYGGALRLIASNLPAGVTMTSPDMPANGGLTPVLFEATAAAPLEGRLCGLSAVEVETQPADAKASGGKSANTKRRQPAPIDAQFEQIIPLVKGQNNYEFCSTRADRMAVATVDASPFAIEFVQPRVPIVQSGSMALRVVARREKGFDGPIEIRLMDHPPGISSGTVEIPAGKNEITIPLSASEEARPGTYQIVAMGTAQFTRANASTGKKGPGQNSVGQNPAGLVYSATRFANLEVAAPFVTGKLQMAAIEQGQNGSITCELQMVTPFSGKAKIEVLGLPGGVTAVEKEISAADQHVSIPLSVEPNARIGQNATLFCQFTIYKDGEPIIHNIARGGVLRIDAPPRKPARATGAKPKPQANPNAPAPVLSRLDKLREQQQQENGN